MNNGYIIESLSATSSIDAVIIAAMITGAVAIIGALVNSIISYRTKRIEYRYIEEREKQQERRVKQEKMIGPYNKLISLTLEIILNSGKQGKHMSANELQKRYKEFNSEVLLHGSNEVIAKWGAYRVKIAQSHQDPKEVMLGLEEVLYAIREDLGFDTKGVNKGDILNLFINDTENWTGEK